MESENELLAMLDELLPFERQFEVVNRFNVFEAVNMGKQEIHHSRFLAFMLDPAQSHGLGDRFLRALLLATAANCPNSPVSKLSLTITDFSGALVYCERDHIDITVQIPELRLMFIIENKIEASERTDQLKDYRELIEARYPVYKFMGCFLTPDGYPGDDDIWAPLSYRVIASELRRLLEEEAPAESVAIIVKHYVQLIEKEIMVSEELISACRKIYAQHRTAFNLIVQHGQVPVLTEAFRSFQADHSKLKALAMRSNVVVFVDAGWLAIDGFQEADSTRWEATCPVKFWFQLDEKKLRIFLEVGPVKADSNFPRSRFVDELGGTAGRTGRGIYTRVQKREHKLPEGADVDTVKRAMDELWTDIKGDALTEMVKNAAEICLKS